MKYTAYTFARQVGYTNKRTRPPSAHRSVSQSGYEQRRARPLVKSRSHRHELTKLLGTFHSFASSSLVAPRPCIRAYAAQFIQYLLALIIIGRRGTSARVDGTATRHTQTAIRTLCIFVIVCRLFRKKRSIIETVRIGHEETSTKFKNAARAVTMIL